MSDAPSPPDFLEDLRSTTERLLRERGVDERLAPEVSERLADEIRRLWGGHQIYIAMLSRAQIAERDREIARRFDGRNAIELCREYGLSSSHLRRILAEARAKR